MNASPTVAPSKSIPLKDNVWQCEEHSVYVTDVQLCAHFKPFAPDFKGPKVVIK